MAEAVGKKVFKRHLDVFLKPLFDTLSRITTSQLARHAAVSCVKRLSSLVGPSIFRGRLSDSQRQVNRCMRAVNFSRYCWFIIVDCDRAASIKLLYKGNALSYDSGAKLLCLVQLAHRVFSLLSYWRAPDIGLPGGNGYVGRPASWDDGHGHGQGALGCNGVGQTLRGDSWNLHTKIRNVQEAV